MECAQCGTVLKDGQDNCASCGAPVVRQSTGNAEDEVHRLLAEANLLRIRKQLDEAIGLCTRVLRLDPANATAHALMGDIYRDEGNFRESLGWYKLAVQLDPTSEADRKKLDEMIDQVFQDVQQGDGQSTAMTESTVADVTTTRSTNGPWAMLRGLLEKITPTHVIIGSTVLAVIVVIFIVTASSGEKQHVRQTEPTQQPVVATNPDQTTPAVVPPNGQMPQVVPPAPDSVEGGTKLNGLPVIVQNSPDKSAATPPAANAPQQPVAPRPGATNSVPVAQVPPFIPKQHTRMTSEELQKETKELRAALLNSLKESKLPSTLVDVFIDPMTKVATINYNIPNMRGPSETKMGLLYSGFFFIWQSQKADSTLRSFTIRGYAYPISAHEPPSLALQADVSPQQADEASEAGDYKTVAGCMSKVWWRGDLESAPL